MVTVRVHRLAIRPPMALPFPLHAPATAADFLCLGKAPTPPDSGLEHPSLAARLWARARQDCRPPVQPLSQRPGQLVRHSP
jgi:hypothetical protein